MNYRASALSVGVPVYNQAPTIRETINSLLRQELRPAEIVISDNHSTDGTSNILSEFSKQVRIVRPPTFLDMARSWNFCVSQLNTPWFALISGDDLAHPNYVQALERGTRVDEAAVVVRAGWRVIDEHGRSQGIRRILTVDRITHPPKNIYEQLVTPKVSFAAFAARRDACTAVGGFPEDLRLYSDWGMWLRLASAGSFVYEDEVVSSYRVPSSDGRRVTRLKDLLLDELTISRRIIPEVTRQHVDTRRIADAKRQRLERFLVTYADLRREIEGHQLLPILDELAFEASGQDLLSLWLNGQLRPRITLKGTVGQLRLMRTVYATLRKYLSFR